MTHSKFPEWFSLKHDIVFLVQSFFFYLRNYHHCNNLVARSENWNERSNQSHRIFVALVPLQPPSSQPFRSPSPVIGLKLVPFLLVASILSKVIASAQLLACLVDRNKQTIKNLPQISWMSCTKEWTQQRRPRNSIITKKRFPSSHPKARFCSRPRLVRWQRLHGTHHCLVFSFSYPSSSSSSSPLSFLPHSPHPPDCLIIALPLSRRGS